jgi:hypothetical protein
MNFHKTQPCQPSKLPCRSGSCCSEDPPTHAFTFFNPSSTQFLLQKLPHPRTCVRFLKSLWSQILELSGSPQSKEEEEEIKPVSICDLPKSSSADEMPTGMSSMSTGRLSSSYVGLETEWTSMLGMLPVWLAWAVTHSKHGLTVMCNHFYQRMYMG